MQRNNYTGPSLYGFHARSENVIPCAKPTTMIGGGNQASSVYDILLSFTLLRLPAVHRMPYFKLENNDVASINIQPQLLQDTTTWLNH